MKNSILNLIKTSVSAGSSALLGPGNSSSETSSASGTFTTGTPGNSSSDIFSASGSPFYKNILNKTYKYKFLNSPYLFLTFTRHGFLFYICICQFFRFRYFLIVSFISFFAVNIHFVNIILFWCNFSFFFVNIHF